MYSEMGGGCTLYRGLVAVKISFVSRSWEEGWVLAAKFWPLALTAPWQ